MQSFDLVVIGSGPSGQRAAIQAAKLGKQVAVIERRREVGGVCINTGTIPSKTLREAVLDLSGLRQRSLYGDSFRGKEDISPEDLFTRTGLIMQREREVVRSQLLRNHVRLIEGNARLDGAHHVLIETAQATNKLEAAFIVLATGSTPSVPRGVAIDHETVLTSDDILSLKKLPRTMIVVGAGIIGVEYATIFAALGVRVTLIDKRTELLDMVDREVVNALVYQAGALGVTLRLGEEVAQLESDATGPRVVLASGKRLAADVVLVSSGRQGASDQIGLETAGITADERGRVAVNEHYQTAAPNVYAVGDLIGFPALASTSMEQGRRAALHAFQATIHTASELFPFGIYAIPEIGWVGATEQDLTKRGIPFETGLARYREIARGQILGDLDGMLKLIFNIETRQILGVWAMGTQATELVHIGQTAMALGGTLEYFVQAVFNYPTLAECYKVAALDGYNKLNRLNDSVKKDEVAIP